MSNSELIVLCIILAVYSALHASHMRRIYLLEKQIKSLDSQDASDGMTASDPIRPRSHLSVPPSHFYER